MEKTKKSIYKIDKNGNKRVMVSWYMEESLYNKLYEISKQEKCTMTTLYNKILEVYINCYDKISLKTNRILEKAIEKSIDGKKEVKEEEEDEED